MKIDPFNWAVDRFMSWYNGIDCDSLVDGIERVEVLMYHKRYERAVEVLSSLLRMEGSDTCRAHLMFLRGKAKGKLGRSRDAQRDLRYAIRMEPNNLVYMLELGRVLMRSQQYHKALEIFDQCVQMDPLSPEAYNCKALLFDRMGEYDLARSNFKQALVLKPNSAVVYNNLGVLCIHEGNNLEAKQHLLMAQDIDPSLEAIDRNRSYINQPEKLKSDKTRYNLCTLNLLSSIQELCSFTQPQQ